jgi:putative nucleotidyltransferase with HDIG domain
LFAATLLAAIVAESLDVLAAAATVRVRGRAAWPVFQAHGPLVLTSVPTYGPVVALLAYAYLEVSPVSAALFFIPGLAAQRLFKLYRDKARLLEAEVALTSELQQANNTLETANLSFAEALVQTLEESDRYTAGHSKAVAIYTRDIAIRLGLDEEAIERAFLCGLVHDIGKIGLAPSLLNKEGRLTLEERRQMEKHSEIGERILQKVDAYSDVAIVVRHHHERLDGEGYPDRLRMTDIPLTSRMIAVADAYNAMTSDRPYRRAMDYPAARDRLLQAMGSQFDIDVVISFLGVLADCDTDYRRARGPEFGRLDYWSLAARTLTAAEVA